MERPEPPIQGHSQSSFPTPLEWDYVEPPADLARVIRPATEPIAEMFVQEEPVPPVSEDLELAAEAVVMLSCPWYRKVGICTVGCREEPACQVNEPEGGWQAQLLEAAEAIANPPEIIAPLLQLAREVTSQGGHDPQPPGDAP